MLGLSDAPKEVTMVTGDRPSADFSTECNAARLADGSAILRSIEPTNFKSTK